ncbi:GumC family protein [Aquabacter spiritensis]|uniref:Capsular exopolysaccharide synthesis family protein n=1 Tax=Aquabacter spiritensis TaxID=933073 RepID=A0A4R3LTS9_9HYPH|nr:polysaccharide biosynthesis tyrosine autokinase [Aquabacter spiritensis]TCT03980.1 capsular exopolysaccharide synthesis family protein [Aquabacter spiritensis]
MVDDAPSSGQQILRYVRILLKRKWLILAITLAFGVIGAVRTMMETPLYTSSVRLQIDRNVAKVVEGGNVTPVEGFDFDFLRTQNELLQSRAIAERVASALKLGNDPDFLSSRSFSLLGGIEGLFSTPQPASTPDKAALERAAAGRVLANRTVRPVSGARLVDISYTDPSPVRAQRIAAAFGDAFIASNLDKRFQANAYAKAFLEDQVRQVKLRLEDSEQRLLEFAQKQQIVGTATEKSSIAESNFAAANAALGILVSERIRNEQQWRQIESSGTINLPQILSNTVVDGLRARRNALAVDYQEKLETYKPSYPSMVEISNRIKELDRQLASEIQAIRSSYKAAYEASVAQENDMKARIEVLRREVLDLQERSIQYNTLKREVDTNRDLYASLLQRWKEVDVAGGAGVNNVFVVDNAIVPGGPSSPNVPRALMIALSLGLVVGVAAAVGLDHFDDKIRSAEELERASGLPTLGILPKVRGAVEPIAALKDPRSALSEAYRSLCTALQFSTENGLPSNLVVTSAVPAEGKSLTAIAIARHFATLGLKVLLIDADLRNPSLHIKTGLSNTVGFSNYLTGACTPPEAMQGTDLPNLTFMSSGPLPPNAADLLGGTRVFSLLSVGREVFDLIVLDGPPVMGLADAPLLSSAASAVVFISAAGESRAGTVKGALRRLQLSRSPLIGTALTKFDAKAHGYGYGHGYGHAYGYGGASAFTYGGAAGEPPPAQLGADRPRA